MKIKYKQIAKSLTGFSTPFFGVSWNPPATDREIVRQLITFLEDRRVLYNPYEIESPDYVIQSILQIREALTSLLQSLPADSQISDHLRAMRAACRKLMNQVEGQRRHHFRPMDPFFAAELGELRGVFGIQVAQLAVKYGVDIESSLASILPVEDSDTQEPQRRSRF